MLLQEDPTNANAMASLGMVQKQQGNMDEALKLLNQALAGVPNDHEILNNIGCIFYARGSYEKAAEHYLKGLQIKPEGTILQRKKDRRRTAEQPWQCSHQTEGPLPSLARL